MDFIHCNLCFQRNEKEGYIISSCFHLFCHNCAKTDGTACPLCSKKSRLVPLDSKLSPAVKAFFADPIKTFTENLTKFQRKTAFQENMRVHLLKHLLKEKEKKRQMEVYFRKKGQEFDSQKKKLAEANAWIQAAERKLQAFEEEKQKAQREIEDLQVKLKFLTTSVPSRTQHSESTAPFSFLIQESQEPGMATSIANSSPNSTFNLVSPLVNSPAQSLNTSNYNAFFEGNVLSSRAETFNDDMMFNTMSSGQSAGANTSNSSAFSVAFNNMFTPTRSMNYTSHSVVNQTGKNQTILDKTSVSLDNWRPNKSNSFGTHDISKRETSLPLGNSIVSSSSRIHHSHPIPRVAPPSQNRRSTIGMDRNQVRDMRRISSQPGYLAQRKSINNRSNFMEQRD